MKDRRIGGVMGNVSCFFMIYLIYFESLTLNINLCYNYDTNIKISGRTLGLDYWFNDRTKQDIKMETSKW